MKTKIVIAGIGGVGGYFGGLLANHFSDHEEIDIHFLARGSHLKEIQTKGLKVIKGESDFIAHPTLATDNAADIGVADFIIIATKSYDLESILQQVNPCINQDTIILPLLNGVDSKERIQTIYPDNLVLYGCVYIVARLKEAGVVENIGNIQTLYFGVEDFENDRLRLLEKLFKEANIDAHLSRNMSSIIWEKFVFISPTATATSYYDKCIAELVSDKDRLATTAMLIEEVKQIAQARSIIISDDITEKTMNKLRAFPFGTTTSMHTDFHNKKPKNEMESLTGFVVREGIKYHVNTPTYEMAYADLEKKSKPDIH